MSISGGSSSTAVVVPVPLPSSSLKRKRPPNIEIPIVLREVRPDELSLRDSTPKRSSHAASICSAGVGVFSVKGKKKFMEDTHRIIPSFLGDPNKGFFGVYDGHGGRKAADFVAERLHENIMEMMDKWEFVSSKEEAVKAGYLKTDEEFLNQGLGSGACCVTVLIEGQEIAVSNLGDCRAVLSRGGVAEALTNDHRADQVTERQRIEDNGGFVEMHRGAWRVHGILAVSRSIGDAHLKQWVLAEPETTLLRLTPDMEFLVLASDGLWEEVGNQEAIDIITRLCANEKKPPKLTDHLMDDNHHNFGCVNVSPSSKLKRITLVKQQKRAKQPSPRRQISWNSTKGGEEENDFCNETDGPPSKLRRISLMNRINPKPNNPNQENSSPTAGFSSVGQLGLVAACEELANLAVSRGSLDDITVMIVDLNCFRCNSRPTSANVAID